MSRDSIFLLALVAVWLLIRWHFRRQAVRGLPEISDEEFIRRFEVQFLAVPDRVLQARRKIGRVLGVPERILAPESTGEEIARRCELLGDIGMAWEDLEDLVNSAALKAGAPLETSAIGTCRTVGDLVAGLVQAKAAKPSVDSSANS